MDFRTPVRPITTDIRIDHRHPVVMTGSCFTGNIGRRMERGLFDVLVNPSGTIYNPLSISRTIRNSIEGKHTNGSDLVFHDGLYHSMDHHSSFSSCDRDDVISRVNTSADLTREYLKNASALIVTWGTARTYRYVPTQSVDCNCHKLPAGMFETVNLEADDICRDWSMLIEELHSLNRNLNIIFTISPIRYKAYGLHESNLDKAVLLTAADRLVKRFSDRTVYFPAYEILLDDLRDYRFYAPDMIHPSETAVDYIYEIFSKSFYDEATQKFEKQCLKLTSRLSHRFMTDNIEAINEFKQSTDSLAAELISKCGEVAATIEKFRQ